MFATPGAGSNFGVKSPSKLSRWGSDLTGDDVGSPPDVGNSREREVPVTPGSGSGNSSRTSLSRSQSMEFKQEILGITRDKSLTLKERAANVQEVMKKRKLSAVATNATSNDNGAGEAVGKKVEAEPEASEEERRGAVVDGNMTSQGGTQQKADSEDSSSEDDGHDVSPPIPTKKDEREIMIITSRSKPRSKAKKRKKKKSSTGPSRAAASENTTSSNDNRVDTTAAGRAWGTSYGAAAAITIATILFAIFTAGLGVGRKVQETQSEAAATVVAAALRKTLATTEAKLEVASWQRDGLVVRLEGLMEEKDEEVSSNIDMEVISAALDEMRDSHAAELAREKAHRYRERVAFEGLVAEKGNDLAYAQAAIDDASDREIQLRAVLEEIRESHAAELTREKGYRHHEREGFERLVEEERAKNTASSMGEVDSVASSLRGELDVAHAEMEEVRGENVRLTEKITSLSAELEEQKHAIVEIEEKVQQKVVTIPQRNSRPSLLGRIRRMLLRDRTSKKN